MRCLDKNKQSFHYANYSSKTEIVDEYGNNTGQYRITYTTPAVMKANISPIRNYSNDEQYGINAPYTRQIVTDDMSCTITTISILWIDTPYSEGIAHDYVVLSVSKSINSIVITVKKVDMQ